MDCPQDGRFAYASGTAAVQECIAFVPLRSIAVCRFFQLLYLPGGTPLQWCAQIVIHMPLLALCQVGTNSAGIALA